MGTLPSELSVWKDIDLSESYLVCCMFDEAATLASSIISHLHAKAYVEILQDEQHVLDIMESAGMVFLQSARELGRSSKVFGELEKLFGSVPAIPGQTFLTWTCMQISDGYGESVRPIIEQFLGEWKFVHGQPYLMLNAESHHSSFESGSRHPLLKTENYMDIVDTFVVQLLGMLLHDIEFAISWTEKAELPEEKRQELMRKLQSLSYVPEFAERNTASAWETSNSSEVEMFQESSNAHCHPDRSNPKFSILRAINPCFWLFHSFHLKCGTALLVLQHGKIIFWSSLVLFACHILHKKRTALQGIAGKQARSVRSALVDIWRLAFSMQVNPLASVQPMTYPSQGSR